MARGLGTLVQRFPKGGRGPSVCTPGPRSRLARRESDRLSGLYGPSDDLMGNVSVGANGPQHPYLTLANPLL